MRLARVREVRGSRRSAPALASHGRAFATAADREGFARNGWAQGWPTNPAWPDSCVPVGSTVMRVALAVWDGRVSPVFDVSQEVLILDIVERSVGSPSSLMLGNGAAEDKSRQLAERGVGTLICGAVSNEMMRELDREGIEVIGFVTGEVGTIIAAFAAGELPDARYAMPGCTMRMRRHRGGRGGGCGRGPRCGRRRRRGGRTTRAANRTEG